MIRIISPLEPTENKDVFNYVDREGNLRFAYRLIQDPFGLIKDKFYFFGNKAPLILFKDDKSQPIFIDKKSELTLEDMMLSQLKGNGNRFYFIDPENNIKIGHRDDIKNLIEVNSLLKKVYSGLEIKK